MAIVEALVTKAVVSLVSDGVKRVLSPAQIALDLPSTPLRQIGDGDETALVTWSQEHEIANLFKSPQAQSLISTYLIARAGLPARKKTQQELTESVRVSFDNLCNGWPKEGEDWSDISHEIWNELIEPMVAGVRPALLRDVLSPSDRATLDQYLGTDAAPHDLPLFVRATKDVFSSPQRLVRVNETVGDLKRQAREFYGNLNLNHIPKADQERQQSSFPRSELYVSRDLTRIVADDRKSIDSTELLSDAVPGVRNVVIGDPGVGKSTLVGQLVYELSGATTSRCAVVVRCREIKAGDSASLVQAIIDGISDDFQLKIPEEAISDALALGRLLLIFDGLDEVADSTDRQSLATRIQMLGRLFPLSSVLVTARRVGFLASYFDNRMFAVNELDQYNDAQIREYVGKWFDHVGNYNLGQHFLRESESLEDVRHNPLMLSLLCAVYIEHGWLPRNRRGVYQECASLLFRRWDSMRHIEVPFDHMEYGQRLMRALGYFFYTMPSANKGVEENQLRRILRSFFEDTGSALADEADERAKSFLDYCAERAWLLSRRGVSATGQRLFGFTHRTFQEFFAAEALARRIKDIDALAKTTYKAYVEEPSSVLPELIAQAYDDLEDEEVGALPRRILLLSQNPNSGIRLAGSELLLRLVNSAPVGPRLLQNILSSYFSGLCQRVSGEYISTAQADALAAEDLAFFSLYRDPRSWALKMLSGAAEPVVGNFDFDTPTARRAVLAQWASYWFEGRSGQYDIAWSSWIGDLGAAEPSDVFIRDAWCLRMIEANALQVDLSTLSSSEANWLVQNSLVIYSRTQFSPSLMAKIFEAISRGNASAGSAFRDWFAGEVVLRMRPGLTTASHAVESFHVVMGEWTTDQRSSFVEALKADMVLRRIYVWLCLVAVEVDPSSILSVQRLSDDFLPFDDWQQIQRPTGGGKQSDRIGRTRVQQFSAFRDLDPALVDRWAAGVVLVDENLGKGASRRRKALAI